MGPTVAVDVAPAPASTAPELAVLLQACSQALSVGRCESRGVDANVDEPGAVAKVTWEDVSNVRIEVRLPMFERGELTRELSFGRSDEKLERWRSVGLTIATIVDELKGQQQVQEAEEPAPARVEEPAAPEVVAPVPPPPAPEKEPAPKVVDAERSEATRPRASFETVEAGGLFGTGLASGATRTGVYVRAAHDLSAPPVFADVGVAYALLTSPEQPQVTWTEFTLGGGVRFSGAVRLELGIAALLQRVSATASDPDTGASDTRGSWLPGASLSGSLAWPYRSPVAIVLGARASWLMRELVITNAGRGIAEVPAYNVSAVGGLRLNF